MQPVQGPTFKREPQSETLCSKDFYSRYLFEGGFLSDSPLGFKFKSARVGDTDTPELEPIKKELVNGPRSSSPWQYRSKLRFERSIVNVLTVSSVSGPPDEDLNAFGNNSRS